MAQCVIFGGAGFVGTNLAKFFLNQGRFSSVHIADIRRSPLEGHQGITTSITDVREKIHLPSVSEAEWIFNFAAIHREPGHRAEEYFETNLKGAANVNQFADSIKCRNIFFTSSISVYGPCLTPTDESKLPNPITPYGGSKYPAELIHQTWLAQEDRKRLIIARPGVIYGPGDPGNILRMIKAIKRGYFAYPGSKDIRKSYAYIYGFLESISFMMERRERLLIYNYVETPTETIAALAAIIKRKFNVSAPVVSMPRALLLPLARILQLIKKENNPIHPVRVRKAGTPTHIVPRVLIDLGFEFKYDFEKSLDHWLKTKNDDFN